MKLHESPELAQARADNRALRIENAALVRECSRLVALVEQGVAVSDRMKLDLILSGALSVPQKKEPPMLNPTPADLVVLRKEIALTMREVATALDGPRPLAELVTSLTELHSGLGMVIAAEAAQAQTEPAPAEAPDNAHV